MFWQAEGLAAHTGLPRPLRARRQTEFLANDRLSFMRFPSARLVEGPSGGEN
jgi:hypothetical protein